MSLSLNRNLEERYLLSLAREEIEYLRRLYGKATDALGKVGDKKATDFGASTFHRIFTPDALVKVTGGPRALAGSGPESWAAVVTNALKDYESTQHLIGTQVVDFTDVQFEHGELSAGEAEMSSYLQAWHAWPDRRLRLVLGTYHDKVRFIPGKGWQIYDMTLEYTSVEHRQMGDAT
ncbi:MAG: nuclear transport factor 2 family protein [Proteobacteria bacterium]|nr:nuclear transport factor 2 family protein [Pseudomonadota bacterium]